VGKTTQTHYQNSGFCVFEFDKKSKNDVSFSLKPTFSKYFQNKKYDLESKEFNQTFKLKYDDEVKIRMAYTPLAMEETVNLYKKMEIKKWEMKKNVRKMSFVFSPSDSQQLIINGKIKINNIEETIDSYVDDIINDIYYLYEVIALALIPIL
jgi:ribosomal protein S4